MDENDLVTNSGDELKVFDKIMIGNLISFQPKLII